MPVRLQTQDFSEAEERQRCINGRTGIGGVALFTGVVRDNARGKKIVKMELTAYQPMAVKEMEKLRLTAMEKFGIDNMTIVHRLGTLTVGENIICMAACAAHRGEALRAVVWAMDELKAKVPIWKKEYAENGDYWVDSL